MQAAQELKRRLCAKGAGEKGGLITVKLSKEELSQIDRVLKDFCLGTLGQALAPCEDAEKGRHGVSSPSISSSLTRMWLSP